MDNKIPKLNLKEFSHGYQSFYEATLSLLEDAEKLGVLPYILTDDINAQYKYSSKKRNGYSTITFLKENYLNGDQDIFLSFINEILPNILPFIGKEVWEYYKIPTNLRTNFAIITYRISDLIVNSNNPSVFLLDFYYDNEGGDFRRKLDDINTKLINSNNNDLTDDNKIRYQECISDFLSYRKEANKNNRLFYNESLDKLKKVVENTLQNNFKRPDGTFPRIHEKKQISNIIFNTDNSDFENFIDYIIKNIHHENGGQPKTFNENEYVYLWLELNQILYLLNRYKK